MVKADSKIPGEQTRTKYPTGDAAGAFPSRAATLEVAEQPQNSPVESPPSLNKCLQKGKMSQGVANGKNKKGISQSSCDWPPEGQAKGTELSQSNVNNSIMEKSWSGGSHRSHI